MQKRNDAFDWRTSAGNRDDRPRRSARIRIHTGVAVIGLIVFFPAIREVAGGIHRSWSGTGNWNDDAAWTPAGIPAADDTVTILSGNCTLTNSVMVASLTVTNGATLTFDGTAGAGTDLILSVIDDIAVHGTVTHAVNTTTNASGEGVWIPDSGIHLRAYNVVIGASGWFNGNQRGFAGPPKYVAGYGPGGTLPRVNSSTGGAGHGGRGGDGNGSVGGLAHGDERYPVYPGSSSGGDHGGGRAGGGLVRIAVSNRFHLDGDITVNAQHGSNRGGGGAGGSVWIDCRILSGSGMITAAGGNWDSQYSAGPGGGGRIAVHFDPVAQSNEPPAAIAIGAAQGYFNYANAAARHARPGTVYLTDAVALSTRLLGGIPVIPGFTNWAPSSLQISNGILVLPDGFDLRVAHDLAIGGTGGGLEMTNSTRLTVGGDLTLSNQSTLIIYSAPGDGTVVAIGGHIVVGPTSALRPCSDPYDGGSVRWYGSNLTVHADGLIEADGRGWAGGAGADQDGYGDGGGERNYSGGGYGGLAAGARNGYGATYGSATAPAHPGSGGGGVGGAGGGLIRMEIEDTATIDGIISANGGTRTYGGSGGGIYLAARSFGVAHGTLLATGGTGSSKGGGGGRIALSYRASDGFDGTVSVAGGGSGEQAGGEGTVSRQVAPGFVTLRIQGRPERRDVSTPYDYGSHGFYPGSVVSVRIPRVAEQTATHRYICMGWSLTNAVGDWKGGNSDTQAVFTINENLFLDWHWTNQYYLQAAANVNGALSEDLTGWYTNGVSLTLNALPDADHAFLRWSGDGLPLDQATNLALTVVMNRARSLQANFHADEPVARTWSGAGNWLEPARWTPPGLPSPGDTVTIDSGTAILSDPMTVRILTINAGATLTFDGTAASFYGTDMVLTVTENTILDGTLRHAANTATNDVDGIWYPDSGIHIRTGDMTITGTGKVLANERGFQGAASSGHHGRGPGRTLRTTNQNTGGAGHGGRGGDAASVGGMVYGDENWPIMPGSSSGADWGGGRHGGGMVFINAAGRVQLDGLISANGMHGHNRGGGGSGGSVLVNCRAFSGVGTISANGGDWWILSGDVGAGPGGGGRVAVWINVPEPSRRRYCAGIAGGILRTDTNNPPPRFTGQITVHPGSSIATPPDPKAADPGTAFFFFTRSTIISIR